MQTTLNSNGGLYRLYEQFTNLLSAICRICKTAVNEGKLSTSQLIMILHKKIVDPVEDRKMMRTQGLRDYD
jgi:hypothetical protein